MTAKRLLPRMRSWRVRGLQKYHKWFGWGAVLPIALALADRVAPIRNSTGWETVWEIFTILIVTALVVGVLWVLTRPYQYTPSAWARLDVATDKRWWFRVDKWGEVVIEPIQKSRGQDEIWALEISGVSLAVAPDGTIVASAVGQALRLSTVNIRNADVREWKTFAVPLEDGQPRVLAVARRGGSDVWLALAIAERWTSFVRFTDLLTPNGLRNGCIDNRKATHAAFLGARLLVVIEGKVFEVLPGQKADKPVQWLPDQEVIAMDAAKIGGCTYIACLVKASTDEKDATRQLLVVEEGNTNREECNVEPWTEHVSLVRAPSGSPESVCVLAGGGKQLKAVFPFRKEIVPPPGETARKRRLLPWRRQPKAEPVVAVRGDDLRD